MSLFIFIYLFYVLAFTSATPISPPTEIVPLSFQDSKDLKFIRENVFIASNETLDETKFEKAARAFAKKVQVRVVDEPVIKSNLAFPVSNCLVSYEGSGGSIGYSGSFGISSSFGVSGTMADPIMSSVSFTTGANIGKSLSLSLSYSCSASAGGVAQIQVTPIYVSFTYQTKGDYVKSANSDVVIAKDSWSEVQAGSFPVLQTPVFHCVNASAAICGIPPTNIRLPSVY